MESIKAEKTFGIMKRKNNDHFLTPTRLLQQQSGQIITIRVLKVFVLLCVSQISLAFSHSLILNFCQLKLKDTFVIMGMNNDHYMTPTRLLKRIIVKSLAMELRKFFTVISFSFFLLPIFVNHLYFMHELNAEILPK